MIKKYILPKAEHIAGATIIQQLGLDTEMGLQRILQIMLFKFDPECKGITITIDDLNRAATEMLENGRVNWVVSGEKDQIFLKMCTNEEKIVLAAHHENLAQKLSS